jgi:hypothetical protein
MGWDLTVEENEVAVAFLAETGEGEEANLARGVAASYLVEDWEKRSGKRPELVDLLPAWWVSVRQVCDVAARAGHPGRSPGFVFQQLMAQNAMEFADALGMTPKDFAAAMDEAGFPRVPMYICGCPSSCDHRPV